jgi:hypothetical protein
MAARLLSDELWRVIESLRASNKTRLKAFGNRSDFRRVPGTLGGYRVCVQTESSGDETGGANLRCVLQPNDGLPIHCHARYCQELCSEECDSGGVSELKDSVGEDLSLEEGANAFAGIDFAALPGRGLAQLEHHGQAGLRGSMAPGSRELSPSVTQANGRERALDGVGGPQVSPVLCGEVVGVVWRGWARSLVGQI